VDNEAAVMIVRQFGSLSRPKLTNDLEAGQDSASLSGQRKLDSGSPGS
jgi:hypothetical protein